MVPVTVLLASSEHAHRAATTWSSDLVQGRNRCRPHMIIQKLSWQLHCQSGGSRLYKDSL